MTSTSTGAPSAHPSRTPNVSRRSILAGIPFVAAFAAGTAPAMAHTSPDPAFARLVEICRHARDCADAFNRDVFSPAHDAWQAAIDTVPHYITQRSFETVGIGARHMSTARDFDVRVANDYLRKPYLSAGDDFADCVAELAEAVEKRNERLWSLKRQYRITELEAEHDRLWSAWAEAVDAVEKHPVHSVGDLLTKIELAADDDERITSTTGLIADLRRILGREA
jgi:hypothetical protein